jgi:uncharacterized protein (TIGR00304 family)
VARLSALIALAAFVAGLALIAYAVADGAARLALVVVFPVVSGSSGLFFLGVLLTFVGILGLMASLFQSATFDIGPAEEETDEDAGSRRPGGPTRTSAAGGVVLLGPVPIFFGSAKPSGRRAYLWALFLAIVLFAIVLSLFWVL